MRGVVTLQIPEHLVRDARLYAAQSHDLDAVCHVLQDYGRLVAELRQLRSRAAQFDTEAAQLDDILTELQQIARRVLEM